MLLQKHNSMRDENHEQANRKLFDVLIKGSVGANTTEGNVIHNGFIEKLLRG